MSGSAAQFPNADGDAPRARLSLTRVVNNVNQLAKWANSNHAPPDEFNALDEILRATTVLAETTERLQSLRQAWRKSGATALSVAVVVMLLVQIRDNSPRRRTRSRFTGAPRTRCSPARIGSRGARTTTSSSAFGQARSP